VNLEPSPSQAAQRDALVELLDSKCTTARVRAGEPLGFDAGLWDEVRAIVNLDAPLVDLALAGEALGAHLAPVPFAEAVAARRAVPGLTGAVATFAVAGERLVPAGAVADHVVGRRATDGVLVLVNEQPPLRAPRNLPCLPLADRALTRLGHVVAVGAEAEHRAGAARGAWMVCSAAGLVGLAQRALDLTIAYVKQRAQFGVPIGSFQTVQHRLADCATDIDGARLLAWRAAWSADVDSPDANVWALLSFLFATDVARATTGAAMQFHGGYGFTLDHDVQLFYRRAKGWPLVAGDPQALWEELGAAWFTRTTADPAQPCSGIDFGLGAHTQKFREEVRAFLTQYVTPAVSERVHTTGTVHDWDVHRALAAKGWVAAAWPEEYGGAGRDPWEMRVFAEECALADAPTDGLSMTLMVANTLRAVGTDEQKRDILPRVLAGEVVICLGYSEPDAGSDVASAQTTATRADDGWVINGQKLFTSMAHEAQYVFLLTRTDPDVAKHRGLTMFLVPMDSPGIEIEPILTLGAPGRTNRTYYRDVHVPDACRVGDVNGGWSVMNVALTFERGGTFAAVRALAETVTWARSRGRLTDRTVRARLGRVAADNEVATLLSLRTTWIAARGDLPGVEGSMAKLFSSQSIQRSTADLLDLLGVEGVLQESEPDAPAAGAVEYQWRKAAVATIYGGTSEILRGIIAERGLGLPRVRSRT
jgi:alkylation response protein AidB-like acyl-CoA dehydrogenase